MRRRMIIAILAAFCLLAGTAANADEISASAVVEGLHASLLAVMKDADALGFGGRREHIEPVVAASFDLPMIARLSTGTHWKKLSGVQQERLIDALDRLTVATYAARFDGYSGEIFRVLSEQPAPRGTVLVNSELVKSDGEAVVLNYLLHSTDAGWRIVDVYLQGIYSELALRRSEYVATIKRQGFAGLLAALDKKISDYAAGTLK